MCLSLLQATVSGISKDTGRRFQNEIIRETLTWKSTVWGAVCGGLDGMRLEASLGAHELDLGLSRELGESRVAEKVSRCPGAQCEGLGAASTLFSAPGTCVSVRSRQEAGTVTIT